MMDLYLPMFVILLVALVITAAMFLLGHFVGRKTQSPEKLMPYECGNDTEGAKGAHPSVKYYLTAILFVVFDIEVVFMYPWATLFKTLGWTGFATMTSFICALLIALVYCWKKGALEWDA
jgi:NADH-quinone oxidoreductase subunit A